MSLDEVMKKVAEEIVAARKERAAWLNHNTKMVQLLNDFKGVREDEMAKLREELTRESDEVSQWLEDLREARKSEMAKLRAALEQLVEEQGDEIKGVLDELGKIREDEKARVKEILAQEEPRGQEIRQLLEDLVEMQAKIREETRVKADEMLQLSKAYHEEFKAGSEAWQSIMTGEVEAIEEEVEAEEVIGVEAEEGEERKELLDQLLEVISSHPEGLKLAEISKFLDRNWQTLISPINQLVEEEKIRKEDKDYFPIEKQYE